jgi:two-component system, OmpR family, sensor kinase
MPANALKHLKTMRISFFNRLYVRLWLAVVLAVVLLSLLVGWLLRTQAERIRAERLAEIPAREVMIRNAQGQVVGNTSVQPVRVPGRGIEFHLSLPEGLKGGEQVAISLPPRNSGGSAGGPGASGGRGEPRWWGWGGAGERGAPPSIGFIALLIAFAAAVALGSYPVVKRLTRRLEGLQRGVERLGAGDLRARVDARGSDEVAYLAQRFNLAADQIEALVQSQISLLANASHELRSPLARIRMGLELMESAPSAALKAELMRNITELDALIDEILLASRMQAGRETDLNQTERVDLLAIAAEEAARCEIPLQWQGGDAAQAQMQGNPKLLRRMLRNLLENAVRYGGSGAEITLAAHAGSLQVRVLDLGPGVPANERERVFEPFFRSNTASEAAGGVGLGLSLVRSIAQQHGGSVRCLPRDEIDGTAGACFEVKLPTS